MKVGIIGYGKMGQTRSKALNETLKYYDECHTNIIGVHEPDETIESEYERYDDPSKLIDDVDVVFICTPNQHNAPLTIEALQKDKHVFCEKPPALTPAQVREVQEVEKTSKGKLMYGFNHRHHGSVKKIKTIVDSGELGKILWMRGRYGKNVDENFFNNWRADKKLSGGGILIDQGIHMLDLFLHMGEDFDKIQSTVSNQYWKLDGIEDNVFAILENTESGVVAQLHSTMTQWRHLFSLEIFLEKGYMTLNGLRTSSGAYGNENLTVGKNDETGTRTEEEHFEYKIDTSWQSEVSYFWDAIINDTKIESGNSDDALKVMTVIEKIYENGR